MEVGVVGSAQTLVSQSARNAVQPQEPEQQEATQEELSAAAHEEERVVVAESLAGSETETGSRDSEDTGFEDADAGFLAPSQDPDRGQNLDIVV